LKSKFPAIAGESRIIGVKTKVVLGLFWWNLTVDVYIVGIRMNRVLLV